MGAQLSRDQIDGFVPIDIIAVCQANCGERIARRTAVPKDPRAGLPADSDGLVPLNGVDVVGDRGGHQISSAKTLHVLGKWAGKLGMHETRNRRRETRAADTQSAMTSLRETLQCDASIEG